MKLLFNEKIESLGLSYKKEIITLVCINALLILCSVVTYMFTKQIILIAVFVVVVLAFNYFYLSRYSSMIQKRDKERVDEFIALLSYFEIFISNHQNVYSSFVSLVPYSSEYIASSINTLLYQIDNDKSIQPYINFAEKFKNKVIDTLMLSIYQMVENGENTKQFEEFDNLFKSASKEYHSSLIEEKKRGLDFFNSFPLFGAGAIIIILTLCILSVVGGMVNVI